MSLLHLIGNTPIIVVDGIHIKCEFLNPTGSSKDRIAYEMLIHEPRKIIIESTSGNTGVSVAFVCSILNKSCIIFAPRTTSLYKINAMKAYGASVDNKYKSIKESVEAASALMDSSTTMRYLNQFHNKYNILAQTKMAQEIEQFDIKPDCIICGIGTSGTLAGLHRTFPDATYFTPRPKDFTIEGICDGVTLPLKPKKCNLVEVEVSFLEVELTRRYLATKKGLWVGSSTAANFFIANKLKDRYKNVLIIGHDNGWRYGV
jgi:cysteine synthase A